MSSLGELEVKVDVEGVFEGVLVVTVDTAAAAAVAVVVVGSSIMLLVVVLLVHLLDFRLLTCAIVL
jgi:hypothetical protein